MGPTAFPEPRHDVADPAQLFVRYLDFFRGSVADKISGLSDPAAAVDSAAFRAALVGGN